MGKYILVFEIAIDFSFYIIVWVVAFVIILEFLKALI